MSASPPESRADRAWFLGALLVQAASYALLILGKRLVQAHDTFGLYVGQYFFQCNALHGGEFALWMPYAVHGTSNPWETLGQGGLLQNVLLLLGGLPEGTNFLPWFYLSFLVDDLLLILGLWGLGRRFGWGAPARFFVVTAFAGTSLWLDQVFANHRFVHALPMILCLLHGWMDEGRRWKAHAALNLLLLQFSGAPPYFPILVGTFVLGYAASYLLLHRELARLRLREWRPGLADAAGIGVNVALLAGLALALREDPLVHVLHRPGRDPDGTVPLDSFLASGRALNPLRYLDALLGLGPSLDFTLYSGVAPLLFVPLAWAYGRAKPVAHLSLCLPFVLLFSLGYLSIVAAAGYLAVPPLRFFRYAALASPLVRLLLVLLAGHGLEAWARGRAGPGGVRRAAWSSLGLGTVLAGAAVLCILDPGIGTALARTLAPAGSQLAANPAAEEPAGAPTSAAGAALAAAGLGAILLRGRAKVLPILLLVHAADVARWRGQMTLEKTAPLDAERYALQEIRPIPFVPRRDPDYDAGPRYALLGAHFSGPGATYNYSDAYLHVDPPFSRFIAAHWQAPWDRLLEAYAAGLGTDRSAFVGPRGPRPPRSLPRFARIMGETEDKIRHFSSALRAEDGEAARLMNDPKFDGDVLLLGPGTPLAEESPPPGGPRPIHAVDRFSANRVAIRVSVPAGEGGGWLAYADAWHPDWKATVNGAPATIERAFLAYKAVRLAEGDNAVEFRFEPRARALGARLVQVASLAWVLALAVWTLRTFRGLDNPGTLA